MVNLLQQLASLRGGLRNEIENVRVRLVADLSRTEAEVVDLEKALLKLPTQELVLAELTHRVDTYRRLHQQLLSSAEERDVLARTGLAALDFKVLDDAYVSPLQDQDFPKWIIVLVVAAAAAAGCAIGLPLVIEYWRDPIKGPADLAPTRSRCSASFPSFPAGPCETNEPRRLRGAAVYGVASRPELEGRLARTRGCPSAMLSPKSDQACSL